MIHNTTDPEYACRKWLSDSMADESETALELLDELTRLRASIVTTIERLERTDCSFSMCPGPDVAPIDMATCTVCLSIIELRVALGAEVTASR